MSQISADRPLKFVCYYRVSTVRQGASGLGLEAQRAAVARYLDGVRAEVVGEFTEMESGRKLANRPQLDAALDLCRRRRATLVIAKLDRLARNVHFISGLMESKVDFVAVDQPTKDRFMLHVQAAFAEEEARRISIRTREALAAARRRGVPIGETGKALARRHREDAERHALSYLGVVRTIRASGARTVRETRDELNRREIGSPGGGRWHLPNTHRLLSRLGLEGRQRSEDAG